MKSPTIVRASLPSLEFSDVQRICETTGRSQASVIRLLVRAGLRTYRRSGSLFCGYPNCARKDCCGGEKRKSGELVEFRQLRLLDDAGREH